MTTTNNNINGMKQINDEPKASQEESAGWFDRFLKLQKQINANLEELKKTQQASNHSTQAMINQLPEPEM